MNKKNVDEHLKDMFSEVRLDTGELLRIKERIEMERSGLAQELGDAVANGAEKSGWSALRTWLFGATRGALRVGLVISVLLGGFAGGVQMGWIRGGSLRSFLPLVSQRGLDTLIPVLLEEHLGTRSGRPWNTKPESLPQEFRWGPFLPDPGVARGLTSQKIQLRGVREVDLRLWKGDYPFDLSGAQLRYEVGPDRRVLDIFQLCGESSWSNPGPRLPPELQLEERQWVLLGERRIQAWNRHGVLHVALESPAGLIHESWMKDDAWTNQSASSPNWRNLQKVGETYAESCRIERARYSYRDEPTFQLFPFYSKSSRQRGFYEAAGHELVPARYLEVRRGREGRAAFLDERGWGFVDDSGQEISSDRFPRVGDFSGGLAAVERRGRWGYLGPSGGLVLPPRFIGEEVGDFHEDRAWVRTRDGLTFITPRGKVLSFQDFEGVQDFSQSRAAVKIEGRWGFVDWWGRLVIEPAFQQVRAFREGLAVVKKGGAWGAIDLDGRVVVPFDYIGEQPLSDFSEGLAVFEKDGKLGYLNRSGAIVIPATWSGAVRFRLGLAVVIDDRGHAHSIDTSGRDLGEVKLRYVVRSRGGGDRYSPGRFGIYPMDEQGERRFIEDMAYTPEFVDGWARASLRLSDGARGETDLSGFYDGEETFVTRGRRVRLTPRGDPEASPAGSTPRLAQPDPHSLDLSPGRPPGELRTDGQGIPLRWIPPGKFLMGRAPQEDGLGWRSTQVPWVFDRGFWMGETEVTQAQFESVMGFDPSHFEGDRNPVNRVSWEEAVEFCQRLTRLEEKAGKLAPGWSYRLPTEAEWEYAARAGTTGPSYAPVEAIARVNSDQPLPVGQLLANAWGLKDVLGNVLEWTQDTPRRGKDFRSLRGGAWGDYSQPPSVSERFEDLRDARKPTYGFRLVCAPSSRTTAASATGGAPTLTLPSPPPAAAPAPFLAPSLLDPGIVAGELRGGPHSLRLRWIPPGRFRVGAPDQWKQLQSIGADLSLLDLSLDEGFWMGETEVTQAQFQAVMGSNPSHFDGDQTPAESVTWEEAVEFCHRLTQAERQAGRLPPGLVYRLPGSLEWEYAAKAGTDGAIQGPIEKTAWIGARRTLSVGQLRPNLWGLKDMLGNVKEWIFDSPAGMDIWGEERGLRSSGWESSPGDQDVAKEHAAPQDRRDPSFGFRVVVGKAMFRPSRARPGLLGLGAKAGEVWEGAYGLRFRWIPRGVQEGTGGPATPGPRSPGFWMAETELTQEQYQRVAGDNPSRFRGPRRPVENLPIGQARWFCQVLTDADRAAGRLPEDWEYRLPRQTEWEYAARAGSLDPTYGPVQEIAWVQDRETHLVRGLRPNAWGIQDMLGNVAEFVSDFENLPSSSDFFSKKNGLKSTVMGSSWRTPRDQVQVSAFERVPSFGKSATSGFRLAAVQVPLGKSPIVRYLEKLDGK